MHSNDLFVKERVVLDAVRDICVKVVLLCR